MSFLGPSGATLYGGGLTSLGSVYDGTIPSSSFDFDPEWHDMLYGLGPKDYSDFPFTGTLVEYPQATPSQNSSSVSLTTPAAVKEADGVVRAEYSDLSDSWWNDLYETAEKAAQNQAERNERSAVAAYERSERAAENAMNRARQLRQTAYQDAVASLKAAGLNPVLAAGGGISGSATTAPQANAPSSSSGMASGLNAADLLTAIASIITSSGNLMKGISSFLPHNVISTLIKG